MDKNSVFFVRKLETLYEHTIFGSIRPLENEGGALDLVTRIEGLRKGLGVKAGQDIVRSIVGHYVEPLGYSTIDQILWEMSRAKVEADGRNRDLVATAKGQLELKAGDFLKGVIDTYIESILQNGSVAKEFLGASADSDSTPLDTDLGLILPQDLKGDEVGERDASALALNPAVKYGNLVLVLRDKGQLQYTKAGDTKADLAKYELFKTGVADVDRHVGIRTGFAMTEVDWLIARENLIKDEVQMKKLFFVIAANGYYIPVADAGGKLLFAPEQFDQMRKAFAGLGQYQGPDLEVERSATKDKTYQAIQELIPQIKDTIKVIDQKTAEVRSVVEKVLQTEGMELKSPYDTGFIGAELLDTGSTGRYTAIPGEKIDFDLMLRLDPYEFKKASEIYGQLTEALDPGKNESHVESNYYQIRAIGSKGVGNEPIDIDVGIQNKAQLEQFSSHEAVTDKLGWIKEHKGEETYFEVLANIVLAKQLLKEGHAYKKQDDGGLGGIGVENWILQNGGNVLRAFETFYEKAHTNDGILRSFDEFRKLYPIYDPGVNLKFNSHDNYVETLKESGYQSMNEVIGKYLGKT